MAWNGIGLPQQVYCWPCKKRQSVAAWARYPGTDARHTAACGVHTMHHRGQTKAAAVSSTSSNNTSPMTSKSAVNRLWLPPLRADEVWYLAYGSNMSPRVLSGRRAVRPRESRPCYVPGYALTFGLQGFPWSEPGFATIQPAHEVMQQGVPGGASSTLWRSYSFACGTPCLHGVLHRITQQEWAVVKASEGVLGSDPNTGGYQVTEVDCMLYDDITAIRAMTLRAATASLHKVTRKVQPSARYLRLLQEGSRHHGLDSHYQQWLSTIQAYQPPGALQATLGSVASGAVLLSAAYTAVPAFVFSRAASKSKANARQQTVSQGGGNGLESEAGTGTGSLDSDEARSSSVSSNLDTGAASLAPPSELLSFARWYTASSQTLMWELHDNLVPLLGSGSSVSESEF